MEDRLLDFVTHIQLFFAQLSEAAKRPERAIRQERAIIFFMSVLQLLGLFHVVEGGGCPIETW